MSSSPSQLDFFSVIQSAISFGRAYCSDNVSTLMANLDKNFLFILVIVAFSIITTRQTIKIRKLKYFPTPLLQFVSPSTHVLHTTWGAHNLTWSPNFMPKYER